MMTQYIVIWGNPIDGMTFVGPFADSETASLETEKAGVRGQDWWIAELHAPEATDN